jgi:hypothetical protein
VGVPAAIAAAAMSVIIDETIMNPV